MIHEIQNIGNAVNGVEVATVSRISNGVIVIRYLRLNPKLSPTWNVGMKRLYKEKWFCVDEKVIDNSLIAP